MNIGYYIPGWPPGSVPNGIVTTLGNLGNHLRELGHNVFYITPNATGLADRHVTVLELYKNLSIFERLRFKFDSEGAIFREISGRIANAVQTLVRENDLDIFQMEETHGWAHAVIKKVPIPVVVRLHGPWFLINSLAPLEDQKVENRHRIAREGKGILAAAGVTAPSNNVVGLTKSFYGDFRCPTEVIPNPLPARPSAERWNLETCDRDLILFVGRFDLLKGADILLRAFVKLAQKKASVRLLFVGPDVGMPTTNGQVLDFAGFVEREIPQTLRDRIDYRGRLTHGEIQTLRRRSYLTVVCSRYENFANTVMESMASGCPTVASNVGGIPEMIKHGRNGLLVAPENVELLAEAIARMLDNPMLATQLAEQAARDCDDWFEPIAIAQRTLDFYSKVIERHAR